MRLLMAFLIASLGFSAIIIGMMFFFLGGQWTADFFTPVSSLFFNDPGSIVGFDNANIDSEFRFYSVFWIGYGGLLIAAIRKLDEYFSYIPILISVFFLGGVGRIFSYLAHGVPHPLFQILWFVELALPVLIINCWYASRKSAE